MIEHMFDIVDREHFPAGGDSTTAADEAALDAAIEAATDAAWAELAAERAAGTSSSIPSCLEEMPPGLLLGAVLSTIDVDELDGYDQVVVLEARARQAAHYEAHVYADMASLTKSLRAEEGLYRGADAAAEEIRCALSLTRRASQSELAMALQLCERLPRVWATFARGEIDMRRARCIAHGSDHLPVATAQAVADRILEEASESTTGQIAARLRRLCLEADPADARDRYEHALQERRVVVDPSPDGTANLYATDLPPDRLMAIRDRIHRIAQALRGDEETRTMDQLRADVFLDLLEGADIVEPAARSRKGVVDIHVDLTTLLGLDDSAGDMAGFGPVIADIARQIVDRHHDGEWRWTVTDPVTGAAVDNGVTGRRPTAAQRRHVEARRPTCIFPGCRMPAVRSDLDHRVPVAESGPTRTTHLGPLCRHDHGVRHRFGWTYQILDDGCIRWTSGLGHTYMSGRAPP